MLKSDVGVHVTCAMFCTIKCTMHANLPLKGVCYCLCMCVSVLYLMITDKQNKISKTRRDLAINNNEINQDKEIR